MNKILSVIIPVYKVEKYIDKCINSLIVPDDNICQQLDIVVINDGTPDNSAELAREWEKKYPDIIRVVDQENRGHGGAWNHGTELARGKYLFYLDSDDWVNTDQFYKLLYKLLDTDTDLVFLNSQIYYAETNTYKRLDIINLIPNKEYDLDNFDWLHTKQIPNATYITHCVYKTELLKPCLPIFLEKVRYDDIILEGLPILLSHSFVYYDLCVYNYYIGRVGQSYDPVVRAKNYNDVTANVKHAIEFVYTHIPKEDTRRREFGIDLYESFIRYHYFEISKEPISYAKGHLKEWDLYVHQYHENVEPDRWMKLYRHIPFVIYILLFKVQHFWRRCVGWIKRKCK